MSHAKSILDRKNKPADYQSLKDELFDVALYTECDGQCIGELRGTTQVSHVNAHMHSSLMMQAVDNYINALLMATNPHIDASEHLAESERSLAASLTRIIPNHDENCQGDAAEAFGEELADAIATRMKETVARYKMPVIDASKSQRSESLQRFVERSTEPCTRF